MTRKEKVHITSLALNSFDTVPINGTGRYCVPPGHVCPPPLVRDSATSPDASASVSRSVMLPLLGAASQRKLQARSMGCWRLPGRPPPHRHTATPSYRSQTKRCAIMPPLKMPLAKTRRASTLYAVANASSSAAVKATSKVRADKVSRPSSQMLPIAAGSTAMKPLRLARAEKPSVGPLTVAAEPPPP